MYPIRGVVGMHWGGGGGVLLLLRALLWGAPCRSVAKVAMAEGGGLFL